MLLLKKVHAGPPAVVAPFGGPYLPAGAKPTSSPPPTQPDDHRAGLGSGSPPTGSQPSSLGLRVGDDGGYSTARASSRSRAAAARRAVSGSMSAWRAIAT